MSNLDPTLFVLRLKQTLSDEGIDYQRVIDEFGQVRASEERERGKEFSLRDHVRGLILSLLSNQRPWGPIARNMDRITTIFCDFSPDAIKAADPAQLVQQLRTIRCGNRQIRRQMNTLRMNIAVFERIQSEYGSLDRFVESDDPHNICIRLSDTRSAYKLRQIGYPLAMEYLRNVGIRASKPDVHVRRAIGRCRLGLTDADVPSEEQAYRTVATIGDELRINATYLDNLLWLLCARDYGNVCKATPRCTICRLRDSCNFGALPVSREPTDHPPIES
jgi:hypothetical protein